jgi:hypothetical protein
MSTLNVSNITDGTTTVGTSYVVNGSAKAWVNSTGAAVINDAFNVSSATDNGTGDYTINLSSSMINSVFAAKASTWQSASITGTGQNMRTPTTSSQQINCVENEVPTDPMSLLMSIHGDLA